MYPSACDKLVISPEPLNAGRRRPRSAAPYRTDAVQPGTRSAFQEAPARFAARTTAGEPWRAGRRKRMYAFDKHEVGLPGMPKNGMPPMNANAVGFPGLTAMP